MPLGIAGAGTMGAGIAEAARAAGLDVRVYDPHVDGTAPLEDLADCEVVIEAAPEDLELKRALFRTLAGVVAPHGRDEEAQDVVRVRVEEALKRRQAAHGDQTPAGPHM